MAWAFVAKTEPSLRARAMRFLARREHSRAELQRKLAAIAAQGDDVEAVLDELARKGWLSDARYAELAVRSKARRFG
ncbi:MAG TPA: regulatory protein RecX, partial [Usitatibacter sp.]